MERLERELALRASWPATAHTGGQSFFIEGYLRPEWPGAQARVLEIRGASQSEVSPRWAKGRILHRWELPKDVQFEVLPLQPDAYIEHLRKEIDNFIKAR